MTSLATEFRKLIAERIHTASAAEVFAIAHTLCAANETPVVRAAPAPQIDERFTRLGKDGRPTMDAQDDWVAVYDSKTNLTWTRRVLDCGAKPWADALKAASQVRLFGKDDWRAPTIEEQLSIIDYTRCDPAVDTSFFDGDAGWCWTSTPAASPAGYAWGVNLDFGDSLRGYQADDNHVRAVRSGQQLGLSV